MPALAVMDFAPFLASIQVSPRRLLLDTGSVHATVPLLRGVWGAALHSLDNTVYRRVFDPTDDAVPGYLLRPAPPDPQMSPAIDWFLFGDACAHDAVLRRAWDFAGGRGLGPRREPFVIRRMMDLGPDGLATATAGPWGLERCRWPAATDAPCRLRFRAPLRLRRHGRLLERPTLTDLVVAAGRRVAAWLPADRLPAWRKLEVETRQRATRLPCGAWQGERLDLHRYSARQHDEIDLHGVCGILELPEGPGELWPLLAAAAWLHLGKATVFGLGQLEVEIDAA